MYNIDIAIVLFNEHVFAYLVSMPIISYAVEIHLSHALPVDKGVVNVELEDKIHQRFLRLAASIRSMV